MNQKTKRRPLWLLAAVLLILAACAPPVPAPAAPANNAPSASSQPATTELRSITVCKSALTTENSPLLYAQENGLFAKHGLTANVIAIDGGPEAVAALIAGDIDICSTAGSPIVAARAAGADVRLIAGMVNTYVYSLIVPPDIQTPDDLRGGAIAVSDFGSSSDTAARAALKKLGLEPDKDVTITPVGGQRDRLAALKAGAVQGTLLSPPQTGMADELGFKVLVDMYDLGIPFQHTAIASTGRFIDENPEVIESFLAAVVEALTAMQTDEAGAKEVIAAETGLDPVADAALLDAAVQVNVRRYMNHKPYPTLDGIRTIMAEQAQDNPDVMKLQPEDVVDTRALEELDRQGLLDGLGQAPVSRLQ